MRFTFALLTATLVCALPTVRAAETLPGVEKRFAVGKPAPVKTPVPAEARAEETPSFQRHVIPLLGRMGCNGRACHGSFQGQGGFRLSLFGYDFASDHKAIAEEKSRVNVKDVSASLLLQKPTEAVPHGGGKRLEPGTWQYRLLERWISAGMPSVGDNDARFHTLHVEPTEIVFRKGGESAQLKVVAEWDDGAREDVTALCRFRSNDDAIATIDAQGRITVHTPGDTAVVAFYDNGVVPVSVLLPVSQQTGDRFPNVPAPTAIDEHIHAKLRKLGVVPSALCTDAEFLRRASLDITGTLPGPDEITKFLVNTSPKKRAEKIDELLETPAYAAWWATRLGDMTGNHERNGPLGGEQGLNREKAKLWYAWLHRRVKENVPYDKIVEGIVLATGRKGEQSFEEYCEEMSAYFRKENPADFSLRETMPYFWARKTANKPEDRALSFAHAFLGVSLQCAQCHKHPYDQWTKQDFDAFTAFFQGIRSGDTETMKNRAMKKELGLTADPDSGAYKRLFVDLLAKGTVVPFQEVTVPRPKKVQARFNPATAKKLGRVITPKLLGGEEVVDNNFHDPRMPLMNWVREGEHPYFAKAIVNRVWGNYFHTAIISPPDDLNLANPPSNAELLDHLCREFVAHNYDLKWLHRAIANSHAYQRSTKANDTNRNDERNFSRAVVRRLPAEVVADALVMSTASTGTRREMTEDPVTTRVIGHASGISAKTPRELGYLVGLFGKPPRAINCDCERSNEPSLLQTVYLRNDPELLTMLDRDDGWLSELLGQDGAAQMKRDRKRSVNGVFDKIDPIALKSDLDTVIREAYLRTLSRLPEKHEVETAREHMQEAGGATTTAVRDLLWVLLNTREFLVIK